MHKWLLRIAIAVVLSPIANATAFAQQPPAAEQVFKLAVSRDADQALRLEWTISPGNYLYRDKITVTRSDGFPLETDTPRGEHKDDPSFGETQVYHRTAYAVVEPSASPPNGTLTVSYQGCAEQGICYPPLMRTVDLASLRVIDPVKNARPETSPSDEWISSEPGTPFVDTSGTTDEQAVLRGSWTSTIFSFLGFGLLLAFTPCMFPMIPILSGILAQSGGRLTARRGAALSIAYVVAMATAYAALGVAVAWSGQNLQAALQTPLAIGMMSAVFVALALSMFGFYDLQLPQAWQSRLSGADMGRSGSILGAGIMGFGSALIVGPCVTPPLAAALVYVAQTADVVRGAAALFALGLGMGLPLVAYGTFGAGAIPKPGPWLSVVKHVFGLVFVGMAIWILSRVVPQWATLFLAGLLFVALGVALLMNFLRRRKAAGAWPSAILAVSLMALIPGALAIVGSVNGPSVRVFEMVGLSTGPDGNAEASPYERVTTTQALDLALGQARQKGKAVVLDFTADWCVECKIMDRTVFGNPEVAERLRDVVLIRADATDYNDDTRKLMSRFDVVGPPTVLFMKSRATSEIPDTRIIGPADARTFLARLDRLHPSTTLTKSGE
ncbi:protein-disulfide reductase DsbD [Tardiphaga sp.]|uniref:protein-disulfide reductase DsbD n=1 Tax=Tardiphaga sp. TaxID=1926292 RepID=UPI00352A3A21